MGEFPTKEPLKQPSPHPLHAPEGSRRIPSVEGCVIADAVHTVCAELLYGVR